MLDRTRRLVSGVVEAFLSGVFDGDGGDGDGGGGDFGGGDGGGGD